MGKITDLPTLERPREKAIRFGIEKLSDYELIALLIGSGSVNSSAMDIAYKMLSDNNGLFHLVKKPFRDLINYKGMGERKAIKISAAFEIAKRFQNLKKNDREIVEDSSAIYLRYKERISESYNQEMVYLIILNSRKRIIHETNLYKGNESSVNYSYKQIIHQVLLHDGHNFYIVHNHPSGDLIPSEEDIFFTINLIRECKKVKIRMLDHLIISPYGYFSFLNEESYIED